VKVPFEGNITCEAIFFAREIFCQPSVITSSKLFFNHMMKALEMCRIFGGLISGEHVLSVLEIH
jgi:hypothetical protein